MPRTSQPTSRNVIHLRFDDATRDRLQQEADRHHLTLVAEIRARVLDSFDRDIRRGYEDILQSMDVCWARFQARYLRMELGDQLADAITRGDDPQVLKTLARLIIEHRTIERRADPGAMS
jgi:hypothetical protein